MREQWVANLKKSAEKKRLAKLNGDSNNESVERVKQRSKKSSKSSKKKKGESRPRNAWVNRLLKKRTSSMEEVQHPDEKPRTPRRKLNSGAALEDFEFPDWGRNSFDEQELLSPTMTNWWSHLTLSESSDNASSNNISPLELHENDDFFDFDSPGLESFLDLAAPHESNNTKTTTSLSFSAEALDLHKPRLVRVDSVEQDSLSKYFQKTHINRNFKQNASQPAEHADSVELGGLLDEDCKFTDIDKELDTFYLDNLNGLPDELELESLAEKLEN